MLIFYNTLHHSVIQMYDTQLILLLDESDECGNYGSYINIFQ